MWGWISGSSTPENPHIIEGLPTPASDADFLALGEASVKKFAELSKEAAGWTDVSFTGPTCNNIDRFFIDDPAGGDIKIQTKMFDGSPVQAARATGTFNVTPDKLVPLVASKNLDEAKRLEVDAIVYDLVKTVAGGIEVVYTAQNLPFPLAAREALSCRTTKPQDNGSVLLASTSINDPNLKIGDGRVRSVLTIAGWSFEALEGGNTLVTRLVQLDPKGSIPTFVVNMFVTKVGTSLANLRALAK